MFAAQEGHHECLSTLLAHGAEVNNTDDVSPVQRVLSSAITSSYKKIAAVILVSIFLRMSGQL